MADDGKVIDLEDAKKRVKADLESKIQRINADVDPLYEDDLWLSRMNEKHAFINSIGGKPMVLCWTYSETYDKDVIEFRLPEAIKTQYSNQSVTVHTKDSGPRVIQLGKWWIEHASRREYETVAFDPSQGREIEKNGRKIYNLWEGLNVEPKKGSWYYTKRHIYRILCNKDKESFKYVIKWFAWMVQNPEKRAEVAIVFKGKQGAGKSFIFDQFIDIFGVHAMNVSSKDHFAGKFNSHLRTLVFLFADEAYYPGDVEVAGKIKELITQPKIATEAKFRDTILSVNRLHIGMATNNDWVIPSDGNDSNRRYFISAVNNKYAKNHDGITDYERKRYFDRLWGEMNNGGREAMLYDLIHMDLGDWHPRDNVPETEELRYQKRMSIRRQHRIVCNLLENGVFPGEINKNGEYSTTMSRIFDTVREEEPELLKIPQRLVADVLEKIGVVRKRTARGNNWIFPELYKIRDVWDKTFIPMKWDDKEKWQVEGQTEY